MIELESINLLNWIWAIIFVPIGWYIKTILSDHKAAKEKREKAIARALESLNREEIRVLIKEELIPIIAKYVELEGDFKTTNKDFMLFTQAFYAKINDITVQIMDSRK